jgi:iron(III) transport system substrate-binding protein
MKRMLALCAAALALAAAPARAQGSGPEWDALVAAAKKEGEVTMFQSGNPGRRQWLINRWKKDFTDIKIDPTMLVGSAMLHRIKVEREAGKYLWDLSIGGPTSLYPTIRDGLLDPLLPELVLPEVKDEKVWGGWQGAFYDEDRKYILGVLNDFEPIWFNAKLVPPAEVKQKGLRILLDPAYKGKAIWTDPRDAGPGQLFAVFLNKVLGDDDYKRFIVDQKPLLFRAGDQATDAMVRERGVFFLGPVLSDRLRPYEQAGMKFDMRPLGNDPESGFLGTDGVSIAVFNKRPHPNATRLFVNWILSKEVSRELAEVQRMNSRRSDVAAVTGTELTAIPGRTYIEPARQEMQEFYKKAVELTKQLMP